MNTTCFYIWFQVSVWGWIWSLQENEASKQQPEETNLVVWAHTATKDIISEDDGKYEFEGNLPSGVALLKVKNLLPKDW